MTNTIVPATAGHVFALAPRLRMADVREIMAASGDTPEEALLMSTAASPKSWAWLSRGRVVAIFGVAPDPARAGVGIPWMLGSSAVLRHRVFFVRNSRKYIEQMLEAFPVLENWVDCRNTASIQWLAWCGFALTHVNPFYGVQRLPFIHFQLARRPT